MKIKILTGKSEIDFNKWYNSDPKLYTHAFKLLPETMRWGVYQDFFDSVGIYMSTVFEQYMDGELIISNYFSWVDDQLLTPFMTRDKARVAAVEKANEVYNNR